MKNTPLNKIGIAHLYRGEIEQAKTIFAEALSLPEDYLSCRNDIIHIKDTRPDTRRPINIPNENEGLGWNSLHSAVLDIYQQNSFDEGMNEYTEAIQINHATSRPAIQSSIIYYNLGLCFVKTSQYIEAKVLFEKSLTLFESHKLRDNTIEDVCIIQILHNLGHCCYRLCDNECAKHYYQEVLQYVRNHDGRILDLAIACNCIAVILLHESQSNAEEALDFFQTSISIYQNFFNTCEKQRGTVLNNTAHAYLMRSDYEKALQMFNESLEIRCKIYLFDSVTVAGTLLNIGIVHHAKGNVTTAISYYRSYLTTLGKGVGIENGVQLGAVLKEIGMSCAERGDLKNATVWLQQSLESQKAALGIFHPALASTLNEMGILSYKMQDDEEALMYFKKALTITKKCTTIDILQQISILMNIAGVNQRLGRITLSIETYLDTCKLQIEAYGWKSLNVASTLSNIGLLYFATNQYESSLNCFTEALVIRRLHFGSDNHLDIAFTHTSIGHVLFEAGKFNLAEKKFIESLSLHRMLNSRESQKSILEILSKLVVISRKRGNYDNAIKNQKAYIRQLQSNVGYINAQVASAIKDLAFLYDQKECDMEHVIECLKESLNILHKINVSPTRTREISKTNYLIGNIYFHQGDIGSTMKFFGDAMRSNAIEVEQDFQNFIFCAQRSYELKYQHLCSPAA